MCRRNCHKKQHLLIFDNFGKIFDFCQIWGFPSLIFRFLKLWETDKLKQIFFTRKKKSTLTVVIDFIYTFDFL